MTNFILKATVLTAMLATSLAATSFEVAKGEIVSAGSQVEQVAEIDASGNTSLVVYVDQESSNAGEVIRNLPRALRGVKFAHRIAPDSGWAVGAGGTILYTETGGASWEALASPTAASRACSR